MGCTREENMDASKKQTPRKTGVAGKKRKKKKPVKDLNFASTESKQKARTTKELGSFKRSDLAVALTVRKIEERCSSSSSSVENQRPQQKMGRFEESSSDLMSRDTASTASHREGMSVDSDSHSSEEATPVAQRSTDVNLISHLQPPTPTSSRNGWTRTTDTRTEEPPPPIPANNSVVCRETLRWEGTLSDDEEEKARIERYKESRRKRYQEALMQRKEHISRNAGRKQLYYTSPTTLATAATAS